MSDSPAVVAPQLGLDLLDALARARAETTPYRHWLLEDMVPERVCQSIEALPLEAPEIDDTRGRRETHNSTRRFFGAAERACHGICHEVASAFQDPVVTVTIEAVCGVELAGSYLRIEYCQDRDDFWLEPHTDIGAKLFTLLIYLSTGPGSEAWGTDIYDGPETPVGAAPYDRARGLIFIPAEDTWHGFRRRPLRGLRRSLIVNYVKDEWRARHELAFPETPIERGIA